MKRLVIGGVFVASLLGLVGLYVCSAEDDQKSDLVIFSYNRPLQLYALLESAEKYVQQAGSTYVVYRADATYVAGYEELKRRFSGVHFLKQGNAPHHDFKKLTLEACCAGKSNYIGFAVDDMVITDYVSMRSCVAALEKYKAYGFYLRLGHNTTWCYPLNRAQGVPPFEKVSEGIFRWQFASGKGDWRYIHTVDLTIFRKKDAIPALETMDYHSPNTLEAQWDRRAWAVQNQYGLCYEFSKVVNLPLNRVQHDYANRYTASYTPEELIALFNEGKKIDIAALYQLRNVSAHVDYEPTFVVR